MPPSADFTLHPDDSVSIAPGDLPAGQVVPGTGLSAQAQWLQLRVGTVQAVIDCELGPG